MSGKLVGRVYDEADLKHPEQSILVAMADHARDDGTKVFPSVERIAWKTGYSVRQVHRIIASLKNMGVLVVVKPGKKGENTEYRIVLSEAPRKPPFAEWKAQQGSAVDDNMTEEMSSDQGQNDTDSMTTNGTPTVIQPSFIQPSGITPVSDEKPTQPNATKQIMDAFLDATGIDRFTHYAAAGAAAKALAKAGFTPADIHDMVQWMQFDPYMSKNITINNLASKADAYRIAKKNPQTSGPGQYRDNVRIKDKNGNVTSDGLRAMAEELRSQGL